MIFLKTIKFYFCTFSILVGLVFPFNARMASVNVQVQVISPLAACADGIDNDGDGLIDYPNDPGCLSITDNDETNVSSGGGGGGGGGGGLLPSTETKVIIQGKAYSSATINILKDGQLAIITSADPQANFKTEINISTAGVYTFGVWGEDKKGIKSVVFNFTTTVTTGTITTISGIFIPPTIELEKTVFKKGETLNISGQTSPHSTVSIFISSAEEIVEKIQADISGFWAHPFDTALLDDGSHIVRAKSTSPEGLISTFSQTLSFNVGKEITGKIKEADLNKDEKVDLVDFSILLYNWGKPTNLSTDLNSDGKVDLTDLSIMLYWWTG